jgi:branched-chain amino acid transport system substrate-binding protein
VAKENKVVFIAAIPKTDQLTAPDKLHPYVFRVSATTTTEGRSAAEIIAKWPVTKVATISPDYAYGQDVTKSFVEHLKKIKPSVEIVDQQWPKLGEADYTPFINAQMAKKPEAVFSSLWGGHFVTFAKQAKPLGYFDAVKNNVMAVGEAGSPESAKSMGKDYPVGIWGNSYDAFYWTARRRRTRTTPRDWRSTSRTSSPRRGRSRATSGCSSWSRESPRRRASRPTRFRRAEGPHGEYADRADDDSRQGP